MNEILLVAYDVETLKCNKPDIVVWADNQPTPHDVKCRPFVFDGNGYVEFVDGISGHKFELILWAGTPVSDTEILLKIEIR